MGVTVLLKSESAKQLRDLVDPAGGTFDAAGDFDRLLAGTDESFRLLKYVDPYGDTMFNRLQMNDLLADLERLAVLETVPVERRGLDRLKVMAQHCRDAEHRYIWFLGD